MSADSTGHTHVCRYSTCRGSHTNGIASRKTEALLHPLLARAATERPRVVWILGCSAAAEGSDAQQGYFEDAGAFVDMDGHDGQQMQVHLIGDGPFPGSWPTGARVAVHAWTWEQAHHWWGCRGDAVRLPPQPHMVVCRNTGLGRLDEAAAAAWLPRLVGLLTLWQRDPPAIVLTCQCQEEARGEMAAIAALGAKAFMPSPKPQHVRNSEACKRGPIKNKKMVLEG